MSTHESVYIRDDVIRLGQLLKLAGLVDDGATAREVISEGRVSVDGEVDTRRGAQIRPGQVVALDGQEITVVQGEPEIDVPW
ncbi:RNA-binding S4 domain-containing protein [Janibacter melonis]|uniref:RNA-binding S4 domain-containing protein n=1 Tax=Janibacter melonis TaxID=262209 RepID=A0A650GFC6_9MICO|nr:RNA-binding S4 domain-containing protein [Janibacter melonis]MBD5829321.1 RNA-binding S4 domain-containing protein [Janibacter melonis]QGX08729.1 RNA-binding S4 domain-containing protein [Janibacter melonis]